MFKNLIKNLSILKKFLFINFLIFLVIGTLTYIYLRSVQPNLIKNKAANHIEIIQNTTSHIQRLNIKFNTDDIRKFLFSTRFLFQNLDRVILFNKKFKKLGDTDTLDLDPRSFSQRLEVIDTSQGIKNGNQSENNNSNNKKEKSIFKILETYANSKEFGKPFTFTQESYDDFNLTTIKNINIEGSTIGYIAITENANDIKVAINERKNFIIRTAILVAIVIIIFSFVLNRFFLRPIRNLVSYTNIIKDKSKEKTNIENIKNRNDELGVLSKSMDEMTKELNKRINTAENFSTDLVHEIRNPLASLKSASEIISETEDKNQRNKLIEIVSHDVQRIERLITDYSQMLKDEVAINLEKMIKINLVSVTKSVVDDFNGIYNSKRGINIKLKLNGSKNYNILGIESRIEQIIANLLENSISFSKDNQQIEVEIKKSKNRKINLYVVDQGEGFREKDTAKIFRRFYSNRPGKFGEHSGLGLNIVKNLVELHNGQIFAYNNKEQGAKIEIIFPEAQ